MRPEFGDEVMAFLGSSLVFWMNGVRREPHPTGFEFRRPWRDAGSDLAASKRRLSHRHGIKRRGGSEPGRLLGFCLAMLLRLGRCPQPRSVCLGSKSSVPSGTQKMIGMGFQGRCPWLMSLVPPGRSGGVKDRVTEQ
jgi:hypothetical protein